MKTKHTPHPDWLLQKEERCAVIVDHKTKLKINIYIRTFTRTYNHDEIVIKMQAMTNLERSPQNIRCSENVYLNIGDVDWTTVDLHELEYKLLNRFSSYYIRSLKKRGIK